MASLRHASVLIARRCWRRVFVRTESKFWPSFKVVDMICRCFDELIIMAREEPSFATDIGPVPEWCCSIWWPLLQVCFHCISSPWTVHVIDANLWLRVRWRRRIALTQWFIGVNPILRNRIISRTIEINQFQLKGRKIGQREHCTIVNISRYHNKEQHTLCQCCWYWPWKRVSRLVQSYQMAHHSELKKRGVKEEEE